MVLRKLFGAAPAPVLAAMLGVWSPQSPASLRCCYQGEVTDVQAATVQVKLRDGSNVPFGSLFPDFESSSSFFTLMHPVYRLDIARVVHAHLAVRFIRIDFRLDGSEPGEQGDKWF